MLACVSEQTGADFERLDAAGDLVGAVQAAVAAGVGRAEAQQCSSVR